MSQSDRWHLAGPNFAAPTILIGREALEEALAADPPLLTPKWQIEHRSGWLRLPEHPQRPWLDGLQNRAVEALRQGDPDQTELLCRRILEFSHPQDDHISERYAQFLLAYLEAVGGQWMAAAERLASLSGGSMHWAACVQNNLAYVQCKLLQPRLACELWMTAVGSCPELVPAWISLRNVSTTMLIEGAHSCKELPPWDELRQQACAGLQRLSRHEIARWMDHEAKFPAWESVLVFPLAAHTPPLSSHLPADDSGEPAGRQLLMEAATALAAGRPELAEALADRATAVHPKLAATARELRGQASSQRIQRERLAEAQRCQRLLDRFDRELDRLTRDQMEPPRTTLTLMQTLIGDPQLLAACQDRYRRRVIELCYQAAEEFDGEQREHWLRIAAEIHTAVLP